MKKVNRILIITIALISFLLNEVSAQQEAMYSQYMFNTMAVNPAYAGSREVFSLTGLYRAQWLGIDGAPVSQTISMDAPLANKKVGLGLIIFNDKIGYTSNTGAHASYSYRIRFRRNTLSFGLKLGIVQYYADLTQATLPTGNTTDDVGFAKNITIYIPSAGAGIYLNSDKYYIGASIPNMYNTKLVKNTSIKVNKYDHVFLMGGYVIDLKNEMKLKPSFLYKFVMGAPMELDLNTNLWFYDVLGLGISYRTGDAIIGMFELQVQNNLRIGYSYDYTTSKLSNYNSGTHELIMRYEFGFGKSKVVTPRYF